MLAASLCHHVKFDVSLCLWYVAGTAFFLLDGLFVKAKIRCLPIIGNNINEVPYQISS